MPGRAEMSVPFPGAADVNCDGSADLLVVPPAEHTDGLYPPPSAPRSGAEAPEEGRVGRLLGALGRALAQDAGHGAEIAIPAAPVTQHRGLDPGRGRQRAGGQEERLAALGVGKMCHVDPASPYVIPELSGPLSRELTYL